jgi:hypothetical protein
MQRVGAIVRPHHLQRRPALDHHAAHPLDHGLQRARIIDPVMRRRGAGFVAVGAKPGFHLAVKAVTAKAHETTDDQPARILDRTGADLVSLVELGTRKQRQIEAVEQPRRGVRILQHPEQRHHFIVEIVVNLGIGPGLADQHRGCAAERLDIDLVIRKM